MGQNLVVSVIIPVFNVQPYLDEALESVIHQTYEDIEIIIIDDGSTDGSSELCEKYALKDKRIRLIHQENRGLSCARNVGLDIMTGQVVAFIDSDDAYEPCFIATMVETMILEKSDIVMCRYSTQVKTGRLTKTNGAKKRTDRKNNTYEAFDRVRALQALAFGTIDHLIWNKIYSRRVFENIRFPEGHIYEDIDTTYRIINLCNKICVLNETLYLRRKRPGSITDNCSLKSISDWFLAFSHFESFADSNNPGIFNKEHLKSIQKARFNQVILFYILNISGAKDEKKEIRKAMRNYIIENNYPFDVVNREIRSIASYWMIRYCPYFFRIVYPLYQFVRRPVKMITGR